jgi:hypothetical protein
VGTRRTTARPSFWLLNAQILAFACSPTAEVGFYAAHGDHRGAQAEQAAAARERERLAEAERQLAAASPDA